jgi:hypothetical protein
MRLAEPFGLRVRAALSAGGQLSVTPCADVLVQVIVDADLSCDDEGSAIFDGCQADENSHLTTLCLGLTAGKNRTNRSSVRNTGSELVMSVARTFLYSLKKKETPS